MAYASPSSWASDASTFGVTQLVVNQVIKESSCHDAKMAAYCQEVRWLEDKFDRLELNHIPQPSMRRPTHLQKRRPVESRCQRVSSLATNTNPRYATKG